jgi:6-pyruvoyl-tetrahydropterin synthase
MTLNAHLSIISKKRSNKSNAYILKLLSILLCNTLLAGCVTSRFNITFQDPSFNFAYLKKASTVIIATPEYISLIDFNKTFIKVYQTNEKFMEMLVNNLAANLKTKGLDVITDTCSTAYTKIQDSSYKYITLNNAKFAICIRSAKIDQGIKTMLMGPGSYGTSSEKLCKVDFEIVIIDLETKKVRMTFNVGDDATVALYDYANTLRTAVEKATRALTIKLLSEK